jgi:predicted Zn-dependent protease
MTLDEEETLLKVARTLAKHGRRDDAIALLDRFFRQDPNLEIAKFAAELRLETGSRLDARRALDVLQICFRQNPKDPMTLALLGRAFEVFGNFDGLKAIRQELHRIFEAMAWAPRRDGSRN